MKRPSILLAVAALALLLAGVWWWNRPAPSPPSVQTATPRATVVPPRTLEQPVTTPSAPLSYEVPSKGQYQGMSDPRWAWWKEMEKRNSKFEWKMPLNFYGKVMDQNNQPVSGASVRFQWTDLSMKGTSEKFTESDGQGLFSLTNEKGKRLIVYVSKEGYHAVDGGRASFEYAAFFEPIYHEPDPNNPVFFTLIKKLDAEPLIVGNIYNKLSYSRGEYYYDLQRGKISTQPPTNSGLKIILERGFSAQGQPFDWTWTVQGVNASVQIATDEFPQVAPSNGYATQWQKSHSASEDKFQQNGHVRLYVRTSDNRHAVADLKLAQPNSREVGPDLGIKSFLNPTPGSRNLEFDPAKAIKP
jgi:hypothetical protein